MAARKPKKTKIGVAFGAALRRERHARNLTQEKVAERAGCSVVFLSQAENGYYLPTVATLMRLEESLNLEPGELVKRTRDLLPTKSRRQR